MEYIKTFNIGGVQILEIAHPNKYNPISSALMDEIKETILQAQVDKSVKALLLTGGKERSFSVGEDLNEMKYLKNGKDVEQWIDNIIDLYSTVLRLEKPTVAAIDGYAIGLGFQLALMFDWRVMSDTAQLWMPELKFGFGGALGATILRHTLSYNVIQMIIYECEKINAYTAFKYHLVNEICRPQALLKRAIKSAEKLASYPTASYMQTKKFLNEPFLTAIHKSSEEIKKVHRACLATKSAHAHLKNILGMKYENFQIKG